jgi:hypothetical protein
MTKRFILGEAYGKLQERVSLLEEKVKILDENKEE